MEPVFSPQEEQALIAALLPSYEAVLPPPAGEDFAEVQSRMKKNIFSVINTPDNL